jgi:hypothetical protein
MNITESKEAITVENVKPMEPQIVRILDSNGTQVAFVCVGANSTSVNIGLCQDDKFHVELNKE